MSIDDQISFISTMCATGESARYGQRPQSVAADEFANLVAQHAKRQFEEGRRTLGQVKLALKTYANRTLVPQLNEVLPTGPVTKVRANWVGQWEWTVNLDRAGSVTLSLQFGPTAVAENPRVPRPLVTPDYTKLFITRRATGAVGNDLIMQTDVRMDEVLAGLPATDVRLRDALVAAAAAR